MATLDDIDEDEAFIMELMAMHPNDDDLIVEDLELTPPPIPLIRVNGIDSQGASDVRNLLSKLASCSRCYLLLCRLLFPFPYEKYINNLLPEST